MINVHIEIKQNYANIDTSKLKVTFEKNEYCYCIIFNSNQTVESTWFYDGVLVIYFKDHADFTCALHIKGLPLDLEYKYSDLVYVNNEFLTKMYFMTPKFASSFQKLR